MNDDHSTRPHVYSTELSAPNKAMFIFSVVSHNRVSIHSFFLKAICFGNELLFSIFAESWR